MKHANVTGAACDPRRWIEQVVDVLFTIEWLPRSYEIALRIKQDVIDDIAQALLTDNVVVSLRPICRASCPDPKSVDLTFCVHETSASAAAAIIAHSVRKLSKSTARC